jgi:hypothetical protein
MPRIGDDPEFVKLLAGMVRADEPTPNLMPCCEPWRKAHEWETDNEMYGRLIHCNDETDGRHAAPYPTIGSDLPPVKFCPWCGSPKNAPPAEQGEKT